MHEFNITIKLENKDYCNGCKFLYWSGEDLLPAPHCKVGYELQFLFKYKSEDKRVTRPDICKESEGK